MSVTIYKNDSKKVIRETIQKVMDSKKKESIPLDRYFGKIQFGINGLEYQKKVRNEW